MKMRLERVACVLLLVTPPCFSQTGLMLRPSPDIPASISPTAPRQSVEGSGAGAAPALPTVLAQASPDPAPSGAGPVAPAAAPKFEILRYLVQGNTLLTQQELDRVLGPFSGKDKDFGDVQRALEALQATYQAAGYGGVAIKLPEQELERGEVRFTVIEAKIRKVTVEGNQHFTEENIRRSVPALREGVIPNSRDIAQSIKLVNESPSKQATVLLRGADREDEVDATIRVADVDPARYSVSIDNTGNQNTGKLRLGLAYQHSNVLDRDHVVTAQFITSPENVHDVSVVGVGYRIPFYSLGDSLDIIAGYSDVDSGTVQGLFTVTGKGSVFALRYNQGLAKSGDLDHKITYGLDYREYQNSVVPVGGVLTLVPDITVHPFSLTYSGSLRREQRELSFFLSASQNIPGGKDGKEQDFNNARFPSGNADYLLYRLGGSYSRTLASDWQIRIRLDAQYTSDALVTGEQFAIGGADNVRGFNERYVSNDKGIRTNWEIYTPDMAKDLGLSDGRFRLLAFYDTGTTRRNDPQPGELAAASLDSGGVGVRLSYKNFFTARFDLAHVIHDGSQSAEPDGRRSINKLHFSVAWVW